MKATFGRIVQSYALVSFMFRLSISLISREFMSYKLNCGMIKQCKYHRNSRYLSLSKGGQEVKRISSELLDILHPQTVRIAGERLRQGGLVAFPTETVYGLGANALNATAVASIFAAKKRPMSDPLIVHVPVGYSLEDIFDYGDARTEGSKLARHTVEVLSTAFWPGPLTIIFKALPLIPLSVTSGTGFVGIRCPNHVTAQLVLAAAGVPVAAPSANRFGHVSPTSFQHVIDDLGDEDILVIKDNIPETGGCSIGIESTVCQIHISDLGDYSLRDSRVTVTVDILRCGAITSYQIQSALDSNNISNDVRVKNRRNLIPILEQTDTEGTSDVQQAPAVAPGQMIKHYAPDVPTFIVRDNSIEQLQRLLGDEFIPGSYVIDFGGSLAEVKDAAASYHDLSPSGDIAEACRGVFNALRQAESVYTGEQGGQRRIKFQQVLLPDLERSSCTDELVMALWERLHRAASGMYTDHESK